MLYRSDMEFYALNENKKLDFVGQVSLTDPNFDRLYDLEVGLKKWMASGHKHLFVGLNFGVTDDYNHSKDNLCFYRIYEFVDGRFANYVCEYPYPMEEDE